jgi:catechol 2,3-dioxygenase-like lactoylglutathione lyase family enzyme
MEPRITLITLGVTDLKKSFEFYKNILGFPSKAGIEGDIAFFQLNHMWLALFPRDLLAQDAGVPNNGKGFAGISLAHNVKSKEEVDALIEKLKNAGVTIIKEPHPTEWGGYDAYFQDVDGYLWEVAWNPFSWIE